MVDRSRLETVRDMGAAVRLDGGMVKAKGLTEDSREFLEKYRAPIRAALLAEYCESHFGLAVNVQRFLRLLDGLFPEYCKVVTDPATRSNTFRLMAAARRAAGSGELPKWMFQNGRALKYALIPLGYWGELLTGDDLKRAALATFDGVIKGRR